MDGDVNMSMSGSRPLRPRGRSHPSADTDMNASPSLPQPIPPVSVSTAVNPQPQPPSPPHPLLPLTAPASSPSPGSKRKRGVRASGRTTKSSLAASAAIPATVSPVKRQRGSTGRRQSRDEEKEEDEGYWEDDDAPGMQGEVSGIQQLMQSGVNAAAVPISNAAATATGSAAASLQPFPPSMPIMGEGSSGSMGTFNQAAFPSFLTQEHHKQQLLLAGNDMQMQTQSQPESQASTASAHASSAAASSSSSAAASSASGQQKTYSRKDKSLGLLCDRFLLEYNQPPGSPFCLDVAAVKLGVERRRIYDIVNILESVDMVRRRGKNQYLWYGRSHLPSALDTLKRLIEERGNGFRQSDVTTIGTAAHVMTLIPGIGLVGTQQIHFGQDEADEQDNKTKLKGKRKTNAAAANTAEVNPSGREQSLTHLTQCFVQMFLSNESRIVSLEDASRYLLGQPTPKPGETEAKAQAHYKSRVRRLYDISNVLISLDLIEKIHLVSTRKPAFRWVGAGVYPLNSTVPSDAYTVDQVPKRNRIIHSIMTPYGAFYPMMNQPGMAGMFPGAVGTGVGGGVGTAGALGGVGASAGSSAAASSQPPPIPRRATIDTAQLASAAAQSMVKAEMKPNVLGSVPKLLDSLNHSFKLYEKTKERVEKELKVGMNTNNERSSSPLASSVGVGKENIHTPFGLDMHGMQSKLQPSLAPAVVGRLMGRNTQVQRQSSLMEPFIKHEQQEHSRQKSITSRRTPTSAAALPTPTRSSSLTPRGRPLSSRSASAASASTSALLSRLPSMLGGGSDSRLHDAAAAADPLLAAYSRIPPTNTSRALDCVDAQYHAQMTAQGNSGRVMTAVDTQSRMSTSPSPSPPSSSAGASVHVSSSDGLLTARAGFTLSPRSYIADSHHFISHYRDVCGAWQQRYQRLFKTIHLHHTFTKAKEKLETNMANAKEAQTLSETQTNHSQPQG